jgi:hypothetical protein
MKIEKVYLGDSYKLAGIKVFFKDEPSLLIENDKSLTNTQFLEYIKQTFNISYITGTNGVK